MPFSFYADHTESDKIGIFSYIRPDYAVVDDGTTTHPVASNNRALDGDTVYYVSNEDSSVDVVGIKQRAVKTLIGVLQITTTKIVGYTKKGMPIYTLIPLSWRFPNFSVSSSVKKQWKSGQLRNVYTLISFKEWKTHQKYPVGLCVNIVGTITDKIAEEKALLYKNNIFFKSGFLPPRDDFSQSERDVVRCSVSEDMGVVSIDPAGSQDLDDAFHIDGDLIHVHIADVDAYFPKDGMYEPEIYKRVTSVYGDKVYHMLPESFSTNVLSLKCGDPKLCVSVILDSDLHGQGCYLSRIRCARNLTYDEAQVLVDTGSCPVLARAADLTGSTDTHEIVEKLMVATNNYIGQYLSTGLSIHRALTGTIETQTAAPCLSYLKFRSLSGAEYRVSAGEDIIEHCLQGSNYTHFTSPIRRYADLLTHRLVKARINGKDCPYSANELSAIVSHINKYCINVKRYYRDRSVMKLFHMLQEKGVDVLTVDGYIVDYNEETNKVFVYLPEFDQEYRYELYSDKLQHIMTCVLDGDNLVITNVSTSEYWTIPKYERISVDLSTDWTQTKLNRKIIMRLTGIATAFGH